MQFFTQLFFKKVSPLPLALFRIAFGTVMLLQFIKFREVFLAEFIHYDYFLKYDFFEWVQLPGENAVQVFFAVFIAASILFIAGIAYRTAALVQFLGMAWCFLIEKSIYNNHYYLFILLAFLMIFVKADAAVGFAQRREGTKEFIPAWQLLLIQAQLFVVYFFGGIAKLNYDWLIRAQPVKTWLPDMLGGLYQSLSPAMLDFTAYFISWSGLFIDLSVGFLLFSKKGRWIAMIFLVVFHATNGVFFSIGYFPLFGILSLVVFLRESDFKRIPFLNSFTGNAQTAFYPAQKFPVYFFAFWFSLQVLLPLRHFLMPGQVQWNMNGYLFAWYMKLNDSAPILRFEVKLPGEDQSFTFNLENLSENGRQRHYIATHPFIAVKFAQDIEAYLKRENNIQGDIKVYCDAYLSLNGRPFQRKINPTVDLTALELNRFSAAFRNQPWMIPLGSDTLTDKTMIYNLKKHEQWEN